MDNPLILQLLQKLHHLSCAIKTIHLCWILSHIGIHGNEAADMAAKESLYQDITASQVPYTDLKSMHSMSGDLLCQTRFNRLH